MKKSEESLFFRKWHFYNFEFNETKIVTEVNEKASSELIFSEVAKKIFVLHFVSLIKMEKNEIFSYHDRSSFFSILLNIFQMNREKKSTRFVRKIFCFIIIQSSTNVKLVRWIWFGVWINLSPRNPSIEINLFNELKFIWFFFHLEKNLLELFDEIDNELDEERKSLFVISWIDIE